ncbi:MAG: DNA primase [Bacteroidaceae bacterium]|nr:DNA primase [Bacteroidaceae bacterium]
MNIFTDVKSAVSTKDAAIFYGLKVGRNGMCCCPFHPDKHPSMKVDNRFHCFGCQADGDVINFAEKLFNLSPLDASRRLAADFGIVTENRSRSCKPIPRHHESAEEKQLKAFHLYKRDALKLLHEYYYFLHCAKRDLAPKTPEEFENCHPFFEEALNNLDKIDWMIETLDYSTLEEAIEFLTVYKEVIDHVKTRVECINTGN